MAPVTPDVAPTPHVRRTVLILGGAILAFAVVALLAVLLTSRPAASYPAGSPEGVFQGYMAAWEAGDLDAAYAHFSDRVRALVTVDEYRAMERDYRWTRDQDRRVVLIGTRITDDRATLDLRIDWFSPGGMLGGGDTWSEDRSVALVRVNGSWSVDELIAGIEPMWLEQG
jgi:hypothetical protein